MDPELLETVSLAMAQERSVTAVLQAIVDGLACCRHTALARIWLIAPGDICAVCPMRAECPDRTRCLHLAVSRGNSLRPAGGDDRRIDGAFRRFPLGVRKIGRVAAGGQGILIPDVRDARDWIARPDWAAAEGIVGFAAQPLVFRGETLGVLAIFRRTALGEPDFRRLRAFADHAAVALANARAFEEIDRLRDRLQAENELLREQLADAAPFGDIVGADPGVRRVIEQIKLVAPTGSPVLILGETGVGKELVARAVHENSPRRDRAFVKVNCGAVPGELFESEFFGHVRGAFTGAVRDRDGRFQAADGGTLFLDEIGEIPLDLQSKLLRVLQEGSFERLGEDRTRKVDVRIIAATHRDLRNDPKRFRPDLYWRLSVFPIEVPPLRERPGDIPLLAEHFLRQSAKRLGAAPPRLTRAVAGELQAYDWPGNIRELQNVLERAVILSRGGPLRLDLKPGSAAPPRVAAAPAGDAEVLTEADRRRRDRDALLAALERTGWKVYGPGGAAELVGVPPTTLISRMKKFGLKRPAGG